MTSPPKQIPLIKLPHAANDNLDNHGLCILAGFGFSAPYEFPAFSRVGVVAMSREGIRTGGTNATLPGFMTGGTCV